MAVGLILPGGGVTMSELVGLATMAEQHGFDSVHVTEAWRSAFVPAAAIAAATERIEVGTYVANAYGRSPFVAGMAAIDMNGLSQGRFVLGVGSGNRFTNAHYQGLEMVRPLQKMREYVQLLKQIVAATPDDVIEFDGEIHHIDDWTPQATVEVGTVPVVLGAIFPRMLRVAGEVADGVALGSLLSTDHLESHVRPQVERGAAAAGRDLDGFRWYMASFLSVHPDRDQARHAARVALCRLYHPKPHAHYDHVLRSQGYTAIADAVGAAMAAGDLETACRAVPDEVVDVLTISGTPEDCRARLQEYLAHVDHVLLTNVGGVEHRRTARREDERQAVLDSYRATIERMSPLTTGAYAPQESQ